MKPRSATTAASAPHWLMKLSTSGLIALACSASYADSNARLDEVIVTAQKREQSLQEVPTAVTAVGGDKIESMAIMRLDSLTSYMPNVTVTDGTSSDNIFIRGVGSGTNLGFEQSVGLYIDGLYFGRGRSTKLGFLDLERVEVLKGPQGILFGKNTIAGAMSITTKDPSAVASGYISTSYEFENQEKSIEGAYGGPLTDTFGARLAVRRSSSDGWVDNKYTGDHVPQQSELVTRLTTAWDPLDVLRVSTKLQYSKLKIDGKSAELSKCTPALKAQVGNTDDCRFNGSSSAYAVDPHGGGGESEEIEALSAGLTIDWDIGDNTLTSITGYTKHRDNYFVDVDFTYLNNLFTERDEDYHNFSQELRLVSPAGETLEYIGGLYFEHNEMDVYNNFHLVPAGMARTTFPNQTGESRAMFGQVTWNVTDEWRLTLGGRYSEDKKKLRMNQYFSTPGTSDPLPITDAGSLGTAFDLRDSRKDYSFAPAAIIEWMPSVDHMIYFKYSEGFKAGGFDLGIATADYDKLQFEPEQVHSYELGSKSTLLDGSMTLNLSVYRNEYKNLQVSTFDGIANFNVGNAARSVSQGADVELAWRINQEFTTNLSLSYLDATYKEYPGAQCNAVQQLATPTGQVCVNDMSGRPMQYAPRWSGHWNLSYERPLTDDFTLNLSTDVVYSDRFYIANNLDPNLVQGSYYKVDARAALRNDKQGWEVALVGKNLNDERTFHFGSNVPLSTGSYYKQSDIGRTIALQARLAF